MSLVVALVAFVAAASRDARADASTVATRRVIDVVIAGTAEDAALVKDSLGELFHRVGLETRITTTDRIAAEHERGEPSADTLVRVWIDVRAEDIATIELSDARADRPLLRRSVPREGSRAVLFEDVAHVVQAATESLIADAPSSPPPPATAGAPPIATPPPVLRPTPAERPTPIPVTPGRWNVGLATFVSGTSYARDTRLVFGAGVGARLDFGRGPWRPAFWIFGEYRPPFGDDMQSVDVRTSVWSLRALPALQLVDTPRFLLEIAAGGGFDVVSLSPGKNSAGAHFERDTTNASPILTGALVAHVTLAQSFRVFALAMVDGDVTPRRYVVAEGSTHTTIFEPLAVRPGVALGFSFDVAGSGGAP